MSKIIKIYSCSNCPYAILDYSTISRDNYCSNILDIDKLPKPIEDVNEIPKWCPLENYEIK